MPPLRSSSHLASQRLRRLADTLHAALARYGYERVETPIIDSADLFLTKAGDQIVSRLFTFDRHNQQLALRPEFTATAAHDYVLANGAYGPVVRWQFSGPIFEDQPGRASARYQRFSMGAELIGLGGVLADSEVIAAAIDGLRSVGVDDWTLVIGHVGLLWKLLAHFKLDARTERFLIGHLPALKDQGKEALLAALERNVIGRSGPELAPGAQDGASEVSAEQILGAFLEATQHNVTMGGRTQQDIVRRLLQKRQRASEFQQVVAAVDFLDAWGRIDAAADEAFPAVRQLIRDGDAEATALLDEWVKTLDLLGAWGVDPARVRVRPDLSRSWDYYTGLVFEIYAGDNQHVAGGGRYDELIKLIGGAASVPAVGFVYYPDAVLASTPDMPETPTTGVILRASTDEAAAVRWARALRERDLTVHLLPPVPAEQAFEDFMSNAADDAAQIVLVVQADGRVQVGEQRYALEELDALLTELNAHWLARSN